VKEKHFDPTLGGVDWDAITAGRAAPLEAAIAELQKSSGRER